ncbi:pRiA4b ORF-3-like protein [Micromonospora mirobrigensis]|uniref:PRiA4b ORF-3-like protein n=1 Tax=Micromonospora mirobrigensis TaxID=262898 RepID=A0A1C5A0X0_9ACTN|nr:pRiA4b ORF-3-like protein [Micromonospora mirobrigensis]
MPRRVFQLKVSLGGVRPPVWRRVLVPGGFTLDRLHHTYDFGCWPRRPIPGIRSTTGCATGRATASTRRPSTPAG